MSTKKNEVAVRKAPKTGLVLADTPDESLEAAAKARAGQGTSQAAEDNLVPFISVLQANSPQCKPKNEKYIEGAAEGKFYITDTREIADSIIFVPVALQKKINEWVPRDDGGGFVAAHDKMPDGAKPDPENERLYWTADRKHQLIDTRYHYGLLVNPQSGAARPAVITLKGTGHSVSRAWMVQMNQRTVGGVIAPSWFTAYELTTVSRSNSKGDFAVIATKPLGWVPAEMRKMGEALYDMVQKGEKTVDHAAAGAEEEAPSGDATAI